MGTVDRPKTVMGYVHEDLKINQDSTSDESYFYIDKNIIQKKVLIDNDSSSLNTSSFAKGASYCTWFIFQVDLTDQ